MSISQRKDGRFLVKYKDGAVWKQKSFRARSDAEAFEAEVQYDDSVNIRPTVAESIELFLRGTVHARKTELYYALLLERAGDVLTGKYVDDLNRRDLETFRDALTGAGMTVTGVNRAVGMFLAAWRWCAGEDVIQTVPWDKYKPLPGGTKGSFQAPYETFVTVYQACNAALQWAMRTCLALCLRPGREVYDLEWQNIDLARRTATVMMPKVGGRTKTVILPQWWVDEALPRKEADAAAGLTLVCRSTRGHRYRTLSEDWCRMTERLGVHCPAYAVRHLAASSMVAAGADVAAVAAQLGHSSITTTGQYYIHATRHAQLGAAALLPQIGLVQDGADK